MIYIIRHGRTKLNKENVLQGRTDCPMNEEGIAQAKKAAVLLKEIDFRYVYSSPLIRAIQTAEIVAPGKEIKIDERLIEIDNGPYEGMSLVDPPAELLTFFADFIHQPAPPGMESLECIVSRVASFLEEIRKLDGNILISTHAIAMKGILEYLTPDSCGSYWEKFIDNCAVFAAENNDGEIGIPFAL